jgi:hypothetical protein
MERDKHRYDDYPPSERAQSETGRPLPKAVDVIHRFRGVWDHEPEAICRLRIFQEPGRTPVVVCSELDENPSTSVTNMAEILAAEVIAQYFPTRFEELEPVIWIEHYPGFEDQRRGTRQPPQYDRLGFASWSPHRVWLGAQARLSLGEPDWRPLPIHEVAHLIGREEVGP